MLNEQNSTLPDLPDTNRLNSHLESIVLTRIEVESVLKLLAVGKASGPNGLNNRILRELSKELSIPFCSLFNQSYDQAHSLHRIKKLMFVQFRKKVIYPLSLIIDQFPYLKRVSLIYLIVSEINIVIKFRKAICYTFKINCKSFWKMHVFPINMQ